jgi:hypothetical protein
MNELVLFAGNALPSLITGAGDQARMRFIEFFTANIRNANTRRAYAKAPREELLACSFAGIPSIAAVPPVHVAAYIEKLAQENSAPRVDPSPLACHRANRSDQSRCPCCLRRKQVNCSIASTSRHISAYATARSSA